MEGGQPRSACTRRSPEKEGAFRSRPSLFSLAESLLAAMSSSRPPSLLDGSLVSRPRRRACIFAEKGSGPPDVAATVKECALTSWRLWSSVKLSAAALLSIEACLERERAPVDAAGRGSAGNLGYTGQRGFSGYRWLLRKLTSLGNLSCANRTRCLFYCGFGGRQCV